ncbi:MAG: UDP-N-acetylmuramate dehydrogenase [Sneathiellales bacterium]|nr:UDP-N-acetylmuramate dehydrogenase [Sneathiellales bacterium]
MTAVLKSAETLLSRLPDVKGRMKENVPLSKVTWFQVGGPADVLYRPQDAMDLAAFLKDTPDDIPLFTLGVGSNLLVRDSGFRGVVIRLGQGFSSIELEKENCLRVGAGAIDLHVARYAAENSLEGAEFLCGIPGGIGGALRMNAGAYGTEINDIFVEATALDRQGNTHVLSPEEMGFSYRHCDIPSDWIFTEAVLQLRPGNPEEIKSRMAEISESREETQPVKSRTGGSTFANPEGRSAWELVDSVGARGLKKGNAQISEKHCNFLINNGGATAADIEAVAEEARRRVFAEHDILLRWEIVRLGEKTNADSIREQSV